MQTACHYEPDENRWRRGGVGGPRSATLKATRAPLHYLVAPPFGAFAALSAQRSVYREAPESTPTSIARLSAILPRPRGAGPGVCEVGILARAGARTRE